MVKRAFALNVAAMLRKITYVGSVRVEMLSVDGGRLWCWPQENAAMVHEAAQERRRLIFNPWLKKKKAAGRLPGHPERRRRAEDQGGGGDRGHVGGDGRA